MLENNFIFTNPHVKAIKENTRATSPFGIRVKYCSLYFDAKAPRFEDVYLFLQEIGFVFMVQQQYRKRRGWV